MCSLKISCLLGLSLPLLLVGLRVDEACHEHNSFRVQLSEEVGKEQDQIVIFLVDSLRLFLHEFEEFKFTFDLTKYLSEQSPVCDLVRKVEVDYFGDIHCLTVLF